MASENNWADILSLKRAVTMSVFIFGKTVILYDINYSSLYFFIISNALKSKIKFTIDIEVYYDFEEI